MIIELIEYAPDYIKNIAKEKAIFATAYATINCSGSDLSGYGFQPRGAEYHQNYKIIFA